MIMVRGWWLPMIAIAGAVGLAHLGAAVAEPPPLDDVVAAADAAGKPLSVELGASWCEPCKQLEEIERDPRVVRALAAVVHVHYDIDGAVGGVVAERLAVEAVPAILVLDAAPGAAAGHLSAERPAAGEPVRRCARHRVARGRPPVR